MLAMLVFAPLVWLGSWLSSNELAGLIAIVVIVGTAFVALMVWLVADGVRDLAPSRRVHPRLDVVRFVSAAVFVVVILRLLSARASP